MQPLWRICFERERIHRAHHIAVSKAAFRIFFEMRGRVEGATLWLLSILFPDGSDKFSMLDMDWADRRHDFFEVHLGRIREALATFASAL